MLIRHSLVYVLAKIVPGILGMATTAILTRLLDPAHYGMYGLALVVMTFGASMVFEWLGVSFMFFYPRYQNDPRVHATFAGIFAVLIAVAAAGTTLAYALGMFAGVEGRIFAIGIVLMAAYAWFELVARFEIASLRPRGYLVMNIGRGAFSLLGACGAAWLTHDPVWTAAGLAIGMIAGALMGRVRDLRLVGFDRGLARAVLGFGLPLALSMTMNSFINSGTRGLLAILGSPQALGYYTAAFMIIQNTLTVASAGITSAGDALVIRAMQHEDPQVARRQLRATCTLLLAVMAPAALGMALTARGIAATFVAPSYVAAVAQLTPWLAGSAFFFSIRANYLDLAFQLGKRSMLQVWVTMLAAVVAIGLCFVLIPRYGPLGAAMAINAAMVVACILAAIAGRWGYRLPFPVSGALRILAACACMAACVLTIRGLGPLFFVLRIAVGVLAYAAAALAFDVMDLRGHAIGMVRHALQTRG